MEEDDCLAPVQLLEHRLVGGVTGPSVTKARRQVDAVGLQAVKCIADLGEGAVDIRHRQRGEKPVAPRMILHHLRSELVAQPRHPAHALRIETEPHTRDRGERKYRGRHTALVHLFERGGGGPIGDIRLQPAFAFPAHVALPGLDDLARIIVVVGVDQARCRLRQRLASRQERDCSRRGGERRQNAATGDGAVTMFMLHFKILPPRSADLVLQRGCI